VTTIATDGVTMAADTLGTRAEIIFASSLDKLERLNDGSILGCAGRSATLRELALWLNGEGEFPKDHGEWGAIHLTKQGPRLYNSSGRAWAYLDAPAAIGTGAELALGAMLVGCSPVQAVEIAARRDPFTGGEVRAMKL
jgi:hypothetical protein